MERIVSAAVSYADMADGTRHTVTALRHSGCFCMMKESGAMYDRNSCAQGFMTSEGRFVSRSEAAPIARRAGQLPDGTAGSVLTSEDLW